MPSSAFLPFSLLAFAVCVIGVTSIDLTCSKTGVGIYITPRTQCQKFYMCTNGTMHHLTCPNNTIFNINSQSCRVNGKCYELVCAGRVNGKYPDTTHNCRRYYECNGGVLTGIQACPEATSFNGTHCTSSAECSGPEETALLVRNQPNNCFNKADGYHSLHDDECRRYYLCKSGDEIGQFECPEDKIFDGDSCSPKESGVCMNLCTGKDNGFYHDSRKRCREYVLCQNEKVKLRNTCPSGTAYNGETCVPEATFDCPILSSCVGLNDGFHASYAQSCKDYFYCHNEQVVFNGTCNEGTAWNGEQCVSKEDFKCSGPFASAQCLGKRGFQIDRFSKCTNYYYCSNGLKTVFQCPKGDVFDGRKCVPEDSFECPEIDPNSCEGKPDNYYSDIEAKCRMYYYCLNGNKITYFCPGDTVYNGEECVEPSEYKCSEQYCQGHSNGYYPTDLTNKFIYCSNGKIVASLSCDKGAHFDGEKCIYQIQKTYNPCTLHKDGYVTENHCKVYHLCKDYRILETKSCPGETIFNGADCVFIKNFKCAVTPKEDCDNLADGFYQDLKSNCKNYFFCISGSKTSLSCPQGKIFNGDICVQKHLYSCPVMQWDYKFNSSEINIIYEN